MYFWATGILSSFLDNAPTCLVFLHTAGGDLAALSGPLSSTLLAVSAGAVFMGANTYIGNAPNFWYGRSLRSAGGGCRAFSAGLASGPVSEITR